MYCKYAAVSNPTAANFGADIVAILTGETDVNNLNAALPGGTQIFNSVSEAGWELWDDSTGVTDEYILRAPCDGDANQYKYLRLRFYISTYMRVESTIMEDWNPTTNTPTNQTTDLGDHLAFRVPVTSYGDGAQIWHLWSSPRYVAYRSSGYTSLRTFQIPCLELDRIHPCLEVGSGYLPAVNLVDSHYTTTNFTTYNARMPRIIDDAGTADIVDASLRVGNTGMRPEMISGNFDEFHNSVAYDSVGNPSYEIYAILIEREDLIGGIIGTSDLAEIYWAPANIAAMPASIFEDNTLHELNQPDDLRCFFCEWDLHTAKGQPRVFFRNEGA